MKPHIIQSHRGAGKLTPENTLNSFELAWKIGTIPEADVRATSDGVIVAFHDENLERLVKDPPAHLRQKSINEIDWQTVSRFDVGSYKGAEYAGQRIPQIEWAFQKMHGWPERMLYLDVKEVPLEQLAEMAKQYGVTKQVILASTVYEHLTKWKQLAPDSGTLHWIGGSPESIKKRIDALKEINFRAITQLQIHVNVSDPNADDPFIPSSEYLKSVAIELKPRGILFQTLPWGFYSIEIYHKLMDLGVESFATDDPEVVIEAMYSYRRGG